MERQLLDLLSAKPGEPIDRDLIVQTLYGVRPAGEEVRPYYNRLDALMFRLRAKLDGRPALIENIRGQGYRLVFTRDE